MSRSVFIDTAPLVYLLEGAEALRVPAAKQITAWLDGGATLHSSTLTLMELLVKPIRDDNPALTQKYQSLFAHLLSTPPWQLDGAGAVLAARYRAVYHVRTIDAAQLACAVVNGCSHFYTNDHDLRRITDIQVVGVGEF